LWQGHLLPVYVGVLVTVFGEQTGRGVVREPKNADMIVQVGATGGTG
jgi:hypothetical protein